MYQLDGNLLSCITGNIDLLVEVAHKKCGQPEQGGFVRITDQFGTILFGMMTGKMPDPDARKNCDLLTDETCRKLLQQIQDGNASKHEVRTGTYSSAVRLRKNSDLILSFAGFNDPHVNEAIALTLAVMVGEIEFDEAKTIGQAQRNPFLDRLLLARLEENS